MGYIPQGRDVFPELTVEQNLGVIQSMAGRCYAMKRGTLVVELSNDELRDEENTAKYFAV